MKIFFSLFFLLAIILAIYPFIDSSDDSRSVTGLPWQIEVLPDGSTQVFGIVIGNSSLADAIHALGDDMELAVIAAADEAGSLEMYYGHYRAGLLSGKLILQTAATKEELFRWREGAGGSEYMSSGQAKKYFISEQDLSSVLGQKVTGVTFIPAVNLDEDVIIARFGEPERRVQHAEALHYLYPEKGLDIAWSAEAKEVLQYVKPASFQQLTEPLEQSH